MKGNVSRGLRMKDYNGNIHYEPPHLAARFPGVQNTSTERKTSMSRAELEKWMVDDDLGYKVNLIKSPVRILDLFFTSDHTRWVFIKQDLIVDVCHRSTTYGSREAAMAAFENNTIHYREQVPITRVSSG